MLEPVHGATDLPAALRDFEFGGHQTWSSTNYLERKASVKIMDALLEIAARLAPKAK
jgi:hypothetical protein